MLITFLLLLLLATIVAAVFSLNALFNTLRFGLPYVTSPNWAIDWLTNNLKLTPHDIVYELGCGDARVLSALAIKYPATKFIGIEIQWWPWLLAKVRTNHQKNIKIVLGNFLKMDLSVATIVYGFFITVMMPKVAEKLRDSLKSGATVVSFGFALPGWTLVREIPPPEGKRGSKIRIYRK